MTQTLLKLVRPHLPAAHHHAGPVGGEALRDPVSDALGGGRHDGHLAAELAGSCGHLAGRHQPGGGGEAEQQSPAAPAHAAHCHQEADNDGFTEYEDGNFVLMSICLYCLCY